MYDVALSVSACVRSGTRADLAWMTSPRVTDEALAFTPGGGRLGELASGAFDGLLADIATRHLSHGRSVGHIVTPLESEASGLSEGSAASFLVVPADAFPAYFWNDLLERKSVAIVAHLEGADVARVETMTEASASEEIRDLLASGRCQVVTTPDAITTVIVPQTRIVIAGQGPIAEAIAEQGRLLGWKAIMESRADRIAGLSTQLSYLDAIVVMGHDVESSSQSLMAALESEAGYIGALGSLSMQQARADWLAYRDITDLARVDGPAGLDIHARTPAEIAVSVVAAAITSLRSVRPI